MEIREHFQAPAKKPLTAQGSAFAAEFTGEESTKGDLEQKLRGRGGNQKRAGIRSLDAESSLTKKSTQKCTACNVKGHNLQHCWTLFESKWPDGYEPLAALTKRVHDKMAKDTDLATEVENIRLQV